jgi:anti-sigma-K factor RskA
MTMDHELFKLLPWVVNGQLGESERTKAHGAIEGDEESRRGLAWERLLRETVREESSQWQPPRHLRERILARIESQAKPAKRESALAKLFSGWSWTPQLALACSLVVIQLGVIGYLWEAQPAADGYLAYRGTAKAPNTFLRVTFQPDISERGLRELLQTVSADIVAGPTQLGDYYLLVDAARVDQTLELLQHDLRVAAAERTHALPERP